MIVGFLMGECFAIALVFASLHDWPRLLALLLVGVLVWMLRNDLGAKT